MRAWVSANGLALHPDKTHVGDCRVEGQGFEFLGYRFEAGQRWVRKQSLMSLRDNIRAKTKRNEGNSIAYVMATLNPTLRGWYGYFQHAHRFTFTSIDGFVRRRLRALLRRQKHRPGQGRCLRDHQQWPNAFFADLGLFTMSGPIAWRANPDADTTDWRARRGRTAQRVRREGTAVAVPYLYPMAENRPTRRGAKRTFDASVGPLVVGLERSGHTRSSPRR